MAQSRKDRQEVDTKHEDSNHYHSPVKAWLRIKESKMYMF